MLTARGPYMCHAVAPYLSPVHILFQPQGHLRMFSLLLLCAAAAGTVSGELSVTTYNGGQTAEAGELIFEDNFDQLDLKTWQHELTLWGGGVSTELTESGHTGTRDNKMGNAA